MLRLKSLSIILITLVVTIFNSSCFFGSDYTLNGNQSSTQLQQSNTAIQLSLSGPENGVLGGCIGPFTVRGLNQQGTFAPPTSLPEGKLSSLQVQVPSNLKVFSDVGCSRQVGSDGISPILDGSYWAVFYVQSGSGVDTAKLMAQMGGLLSNILSLQLVPGPATSVHWVGARNRTVSSFSCERFALALTDITGTFTRSLPSNIKEVSVLVKGSGSGQVSLFSSPDCLQRTNSVVIREGDSQATIYASAREGTYTLTATPELPTLDGDLISFQAISSSSPKLGLFPENMSIQAGDCFPVVVSAASDGALITQLSIDGSIEASPSIGVFSDSSCQQGINTFSTGKLGKMTFFISSKKIISNGTITVSSVGFISKTASINVNAGDPASMELVGLADSATASTCMTFSLKMYDQYGNQTAPKSLINLQLQSKGSKAPGLKFYAAEDSSCNGASISQVPWLANSMNGPVVHAKGTPGVSEVIVKSDNGLEARRVVTIMNRSGELDRLAVDVMSTPPFLTGGCAELSVRSVDENGYDVYVNNKTKINVVTNQTTAKIFSDSACKVESAEFEILTGDSSVPVYVSSTLAGATVVKAVKIPQGVADISASAVVDFRPSKITQLSIEGVSSPQTLGDCSMLVVRAWDQFNNLVTPQESFPVQFSSNNYTEYYSSVDCEQSSLINTLQFTANTTELKAYFRSSRTGQGNLIARGISGVKDGVFPINILARTDLKLKIDPRVSTIQVGECTRFSLGLYAPNGRPAINAPLMISLSATQAKSNIFFSDSKCSVAISSGSIQLDADKNPVSIFVSSVSASSAITVTAVSDDGNYAANTSFDFVAGPFASLLLDGSGPSAFLKGTIAGPYTAIALDKYGNKAPAQADSDIKFIGEGPGQVRISPNSDGGGGSVVMSKGASQVGFYVSVSDSGVLRLRVSMSNNDSNQREVLVKDPVPVVKSVDPSSGYEGTLVTFTGEGFDNLTQFYIGGVLCNTINIINGGVATCRVPSLGSDGSYDVKARNPNSDDFILKGAFNYDSTKRPTITSLTPDSGSMLGGTLVTIIGTNFTPGTNVTFGGISGEDVKVVGADRIVVTAPKFDRPVSVELSVVTNYGRAVAQFNYFQPVSITSISPASGPMEGGTDLAITGTGFTPDSTVTFGGVSGVNIRVTGLTSIVVTTPSSKVSGQVAVLIKNKYGEASGSFTYVATRAPAPAITSISPDSGPMTGGTLVTVSGAGFLTGAIVRLGDIEIKEVTVNSSQTVQFTTPLSRVSGQLLVSVINTDGQASGEGLPLAGFTYYAAPDCTLTRMPTVTGEPMKVVVNTSGGPVTKAFLNGTPIPANTAVDLNHVLGEPYQYLGSAVVEGPGGKKICGVIDVRTPTCIITKAVANQVKRRNVATASYAANLYNDINHVSIEVEELSGDYKPLVLANPARLDNAAISLKPGIRRVTVKVENTITGDLGYCGESYNQDNYLPLRTVRAASWEKIDDKGYYSNSGQHVLIGAGRAGINGQGVRITQYLGAKIYEGDQEFNPFDPAVGELPGTYVPECPKNSIVHSLGPKDGGDANQRVVQAHCWGLMQGVGLVGPTTDVVVDWDDDKVALCPANQVIIGAWRYDPGNDKKYAIKCQALF